MSKKRTSPESSNDKQTNEGSDSVFQQDDNAKRAKLTLFFDTTLQDLPIEIIECILFKAVAMEVWHLARNVWKEKADLVISRLRTVCSQWNSILTTDFFRSEVHRILDGSAQTTIRMEISHQPLLRIYVCKIATIKDEIFVLCLPLDGDHYAVHVYDRNNMAEVKDVIPLPGICPQDFAACSISNCAYLLYFKTDFHISRITIDDQHKFNISPLISNLKMPHPILSVTSNGRLILLRWLRCGQIPAVISMYSAKGSLQHEIRLYSDFSSLRGIIPKSNGNLVLVSFNDQQQTKLKEIDMRGATLRQYQSSIEALTCVCHADIYGRMLLSDQFNRIELLDSEFNLLHFTCSQLDEGLIRVPSRLHYNSERNEVVAIASYDLTMSLTIIHFIEE